MCFSTDIFALKHLSLFGMRDLAFSLPSIPLLYNFFWMLMFMFSSLLNTLFCSYIEVVFVSGFEVHSEEKPVEIFYLYSCIWIYLWCICGCHAISLLTDTAAQLVTQAIANVCCLWDSFALHLFFSRNWGLTLIPSYWTWQSFLGLYSKVYRITEITENKTCCCTGQSLGLSLAIFI